MYLCYQHPPHSTAYSTSERYTGIYAYLAYQFVSWWRDCPIYRVNVTLGIDGPCTRRVAECTRCDLCDACWWLHGAGGYIC